MTQFLGNKMTSQPPMKTTKASAIIIYKIILIIDILTLLQTNGLINYCLAEQTFAHH